MKKLLLLLLCVPLFGFGQDFQKVNHPYNIDLKAPDGWYSLDTREYDRIENAKQFFDKEEMDKMIAMSQGKQSLLTFMKYNYDSLIGVSPTISVLLNINKTDNYESFHDYIYESIKSIQDAIPNLEIINPLQEIYVSGIRSFDFIITYDLPFGDSVYKTRVRILSVPIKDYLYQINFIDFLEHDDCSLIYNNVIESIIIGSE